MAEVSLELKEIKKSFTEGEAVLDNISLEILLFTYNSNERR